MSTTKPKLTDQECPHCGAATGGGSGGKSRHTLNLYTYTIEGIDYDDPGECWQSMECDECGTIWDVTYTVSAVDNIVVPEGKTK